MIEILWFYFFWMTIVPLFLIISRPIYNVDVQQYMEYIIKDVCKIKQIVTYDEQLIESGFILANHRSFADFCIDQCTAHASILGRRLAFYAVFGCALFGNLDKRTILFIRGKDSRTDIYNKCVLHIHCNSCS